MGLGPRYRLAGINDFVASGCPRPQLPRATPFTALQAGAFHCSFPALGHPKPAFPFLFSGNFLIIFIAPPPPRQTKLAVPLIPIPFHKLDSRFSFPHRLSTALEAKRNAFKNISSLPPYYKLIQRQRKRQRHPLIFASHSDRK